LACNHIRNKPKAMYPINFRDETRKEENEPAPAKVIRPRTRLFVPRGAMVRPMAGPKVVDFGLSIPMITKRK